MKMFSRFFGHTMLIILVVWTSINSLLTSSSTNVSDRLALLAFKDQITRDPNGALSSWNDSLHFCQWNGVYCSRRHPHRVTEINLRFQKLEGTLSPHIGNLSFLRKLGLTENRFHGPIPQEIGRLFRLQVLFLDTNSFVGEIPTNLTHCSDLRRLTLVDNNLSGGIPVELTSLSKLTILGLDQNELIKGSIPSSLGNLSSLTVLSLKKCSLSGSIPITLCAISTLNNFSIDFNNFTGMVPSCLYNLSLITHIGLLDNHLEGRLPQDIGTNLPDLKALHMALNKFTGSIPLSLVNASKLETIELTFNQFTGLVPRDLGKLQALRILNLPNNQLGSTTGDDLTFITSLTNCSNLDWFSVGYNSLRGSLPISIANLSMQITRLQLGQNQIYGSIPREIGNLVNLDFLDFRNNFLSGKIPKEIGMFSKLHKLFLHGNQFSGEIPNSFNNLTQLEFLTAADNELHGSIPESLKHCKVLREIHLSRNRLNETIPKQVFGLPSLVVLSLSNNALRGSLPKEVGDLTSLVTLNINDNRLSGHIPDTLGKCLMLRNLYMRDNYFVGKIPQSMGTLRGLEKCDLSHNKLSGEIPEFLRNFSHLTSLNLSYNEFEGPVPKGRVFANATLISVDGNSKLCGGIAELKLLTCPKKKRRSFSLRIIIPMIFVIIGLVLVSCLCFVGYRRRISKTKPHSVLLLNEQFARVSYRDLHRATNSFSVENLIGIGSYGSVYKGVLAQVNTIIAVKVLNLQQRGASKSFFSECNALKNIRHRNLLNIITSCSSVDSQGNDFKALIFRFMPKGSLEDWLYPRRDQNHELRHLNFLERLNIAIDVASALDYLHHNCEPTIVHCDIKPSNVLLDDDMTAHVADFGLAKIFFATSYNSSQSHDSSLAVKGSIGYIPPEYGMGGEVSMQGDVYSYGILLLEMFMGKRPTDELFQDGRSLHSFAKAASPEQVMNIVDSMMLFERSNEDMDTINHNNRRVRMHKCLVSAIRLGAMCSAESPTERMNMEEVVTKLYHIKDHYQGVRIHLE